MKNVYNVSLDKNNNMVVTLNSKSIIVNWPFEHIRKQVITIVIFNSLKSDRRSMSIWKIYKDGTIVKTSGIERAKAQTFAVIMVFDFKPTCITTYTDDNE